jgi:predicted phage tail protein
MKKYLLAAILTATVATAEWVELPETLYVGGAVNRIQVSAVQYNPEDNSWSITATPEVLYAEPSGDGVYAYVSITVVLEIRVTRPEIEAALQIDNIDNATVKQLNDTVRYLALMKALAAMTGEVGE